MADRLPDNEIPPLGKTFLGGIHFLIPIFILVYLLLVERWTAASSIFYSILSLMLIILVKEVLDSKKNNINTFNALKLGFNKIVGGLERQSPPLQRQRALVNFLGGRRRRMNLSSPDTADCRV